MRLRDDLFPAFAGMAGNRRLETDRNGFVLAATSSKTHRLGPGPARFLPRVVNPSRLYCLEWLYRVVQEPGRMWKRYLVTNTLFMMLLMRELVFRGAAFLPSLRRGG